MKKEEASVGEFVKLLRDTRKMLECRGRDWQRLRLDSSAVRSRRSQEVGLSSKFARELEHANRKPLLQTSVIQIEHGEFPILTMLSWSCASSLRSIMSESISLALTPPSPRLLASISASLRFRCFTSSGLSSSESWSRLIVDFFRSFLAWYSCWVFRFNQLGSDLMLESSSSDLKFPHF